MQQILMLLQTWSCNGRLYIYPFILYCILHLPVSAKESLLSREPSEKAMSMTTGELIEWLKTIKLSKYATVFESEDITGEELALCNLDTLKEIGIKKDLDRKKILLHFRKIK